MSKSYEGADEPPFKGGHVFWISSVRAIQLLVLIGMLAMASSSLAQNTLLRQFENNPPRPFQETASGMVWGAPGPKTPQLLTDEIEAWAKHREAANGMPLERNFTFYLLYPSDAKEFSAMARYSILLLTVVTQKSEELPLK